MEFQVDRVGHPRRRLRLSGHSYTFGSGEGCSVRLDDPSVRKTHAFLIRQDDRLLARGYGIAILVNGVRVTEAWLVENDNLQLGDYTLTLLKGVAAAAPPAGKSTPRPLLMPQAPTSPFAETARHFANLSNERPQFQSLKRGRDRDDANPSCRLSFADGMRLVSKPASRFDAEDYFTRFTPSAAPLKPTAPKPRPVDRQETARIRRLERLQEQSFKHAEAALQSSAASTHAVETLADKLDSLFDQLNDNADQQRAAALQQQLESANEKNAGQQQAFVQLTARVNVLETAVDQANKEARLFREKHEQALLRIQQLETQLDETIASHSERQADWELEAAGLRDAIDGLNRQLLTANAELTRQQETSLTLKQQLDDAKQTSELHAAQYNAAIAEHVKQQEELSAEQTRLREQLAGEEAQHQEMLSREREQHREILAAQSDRNEAAAATIAELELELANAIANHKNRQLAWEAEAAELDTTIEQLSRQLALVETQLSTQLELSGNLQSALENASSDFTHAQAGELERAIQLNDELQSAQQRLAALQNEQTVRQDSWQLEREELEYKIAHQAAELSQISALRAPTVPQENSTVANRLAARLQAEVQRLHQEHPLNPFEQTQSAVDSADNSDEADAPPPAFKEAVSAPQADDGSSHLVDDGSSHLVDDGSSHLVDDGSSHLVDDGSSHLADDGFSHLADEDGRQDDIAGTCILSGLPPLGFPQSSDAELRENFAENFAETPTDETSPEVDHSSFDHSSFDNDSVSDSNLSTLSIPESSLSSYEAAKWDEDSEELSNEASKAAEGSPWGDETDEALSGLAAELIGEFTHDDPRAASFADLSESSTYDPTAAAYDASMMSGFMNAFENDADAYTNESQITAGDSPQPESDFEEKTVKSEEPEESYYDSYSPEESPWQPSPPEAAPVAEQVEEASRHDHEDDSIEDDSIEAYMNRLLKRMHGGDEEPEPPAPQRPQPSTAPVSTDSTAVVETQIDESEKSEEASPSDVLHESEYLPRRTAPEHSGNMEAMREIANSSARQAIAKSVRSRQRSQSVLKLAFSGVFIIGSGIFAVLAQRQLLPHALASGACVMLAVYWGLSGLKLLKGKPSDPARGANLTDNSAASPDQPPLTKTN